MILLPNLLLEVRQVSSMSPNGSPDLSSMSPVHTSFAGRGRRAAPGEGRGTVVVAIAACRVEKLIQQDSTLQCDPRIFSMRRSSASPLTRSLRCATAPTSPRERAGRGEGAATLGYLCARQAIR